MSECVSVYGYARACATKDGQTAGMADGRTDEQG